MSEIHLDSVSKRYDETTALRDVDLDIDDGEFFTLVGPSGCGKTTTLRLVAGFESPSEGQVRFDDEDVSGVPPEARGVGVVFQNYALFPHMSVAENVGYGLRFTDPPGGKSKAERVKSLLELVGLGGMGEREPRQLSGGQQQRVALARALAPGPRLLLLDEPMSALDAQLREQLRLTVKEIQSELGITTLYVTHDQEEALAVSDRVAVMRNGRVEQVGTPRDVYHRPETRFVAEFVGDNNLFSGTITELSVSPDETEGLVARVEVDNSSDGGVTVDSGTNSVAVDDGANSVAVDSDDGMVAVESGDDSLAVGSAEFRLSVDRAGESLDVGDEVTFCVRPEQLQVGGGENRFIATVERTEFLGETTRIHLDWQGQSVLLRAATVPDETVELGFDTDDVHWVT